MTPEKLAQVQSRARCLHTETEVEAALDAMAVSISRQLSTTNPLLLCVMQGGLIVTGKLATRLAFPLQLDYLHATRYRERTSGGDLHWRQYPAQSLQGRTVLVIDDILDEGKTLEAIVNYCKEQGSREVYSAVLVNKIHQRRQSTIKADFIGLEIEDFYLFGYGMDYKGYLRNAAGIFAIAEVDL